MTLPKPRDPVSWNQSATTNCTWSASLGAFRSAQEKTELARRCGRVVLSAQSCQRWPTMLASSPSPRHSDRELRMCRRFWNRPSHIVQVWSTWPWKSFWCWDFVIQNGHDSVTQHYESKIAGVRIGLDKEAPPPPWKFSQTSEEKQTVKDQTNCSQGGGAWLHQYQRDHICKKQLESPETLGYMRREHYSMRVEDLRLYWVPISPLPFTVLA